MSGVLTSGTRSLPVFLVSKQAFTSGKQPVLAEQYVHAFSLLAVGFCIECHCSFCLRSVCTYGRHTDFVTFVVPQGFQVSLVGACLISKSVGLDPAAA